MKLKIKPSFMFIYYGSMIGVPLLGVVSFSILKKKSYSPVK